MKAAPAGLRHLEASLLDFHASRYPLFERPSELGALLLRRETGSGTKLRIYYLTDGDGLPPNNGVSQMLERVAADREAGWDIRGLVHNHTFDLESEKGNLAVAAPSESDLHLFGNLGTVQEWEHAWVLDGFNTIELDAAEFDVSLD